MVSLGAEAHVQRLIVTESIDLTGSMSVSKNITAGHKIVGADSKNQAQLHHNGSIFFIQYGHVEQITGFETVDGSSVITVDFNSRHGLQAGDTFHIGNVTSDVNGVLASNLEGTHVVSTSSDVVAFAFDCGQNATSSGYSLSVTPLMRIDRYTSIDLANSTNTWTNSTTHPVASHTNTHIHG
jgi:hypothetical protein